MKICTLIQLSFHFKLFYSCLHESLPADYFSPDENAITSSLHCSLLTTYTTYWVLVLQRYMLNLRMRRWLQNMCGQTVLEMYYKIFYHFKCVNSSVFVHIGPTLFFDKFIFEMACELSLYYIIYSNNVQKLVP